ncbi:MAG: Gfo/Idh/MocA family oxidoreductase [Oscillospiraceae bacterium]|nr:Gfo/Idh/MocA family oxidoreductase [Oscillospiraceae bacterium]
MLKVAIAGLGVMGQTHESAWKNVSDAEVTAVFDAVPELLEKYSYANAYTDFDKMLEKEELDIIDICLPTTAHTDFSLRAMKKGINVICEKPISLNREDVSLLYETAEKNNVKFMVAQCVRFTSPYEIFKKIYETKRFGTLLSGEMRRLGKVPGRRWMLDPKLSGGVTCDLHIHDADAILYIFGKPEKVHSFRSQRKEQDYVHAVYEYADFSINASAAWYAAPYEFTYGFTFQFERAVVALENGKFNVFTDEKLGEDEYIPDGLNPYEKELSYFVDCVINNASCDKVKPQELETVLDIVKQL